MGNRNRARGDYLERQTRAALRHRGWVVLRAAGSLGVADLVALRKGNTPLLISCKVNGTAPPAERSALLAAAEEAGARPMVATREHPGWVRFYQLDGPRAGDRYDAGDLKVPHRPGKDPAP